MNIQTKLKLPTGHKSLMQEPKQQGNNDIAPQIAGTIGGTIGQVLGTPFDLISGPAGTMGGGAIGGSLAQGGTQAVQNLLTGQPLGQNVAQEAGQGGLFGAIPGGPELKGLPIAGKLLGRTAMRAGFGAVAGAGSQLLQNTEGGQQGNPLVSGAVSGAANALAPGLSSILKLPGKGVQQLGKVAASSAENIMNRQSQPALDRMQMLFGKGAITTGGGISGVHPDVQKLLKDHPDVGAAIPPQGDISKFEPALNSAATKVENQLQPILKNPAYSIGKNQLDNIVNDNLGTFFGADAKNQLKNIPVKLQQLLTSPQLSKGKAGAPVDLSTLKAVQREVGKVGGSDWQQAAASPLEKWARQTYSDIGNIYDQQLSKADNTKYKDLINQHKIILNAKDSIQGQMRGKGLLPAQLTNEQIAQEKSQQGILSGDRMKELAVRGLPGMAALAANTIPGVPTGAKYAADATALGYGAAQFGPHLNPEAAQQLGNRLQNNPQMNDAVTRLLQQLGVRLPLATNSSSQ